MVMAAIKVTSPGYKLTPERQPLPDYITGD
jgi:hypothetical protein